MRVIVIGGTGTIGKDIVRLLSPRHEVVRCARKSGDFAVDIRSPDSIEQLFQSVGQVDAVVCAAGDAVFTPLTEMSAEDYAVGLNYKLMGQVNVVRIGHRHVADHGSFTLTGGITARQPLPRSSAFAMVNAAIEGFVRAAALDLPRGIRINAVSPQWVKETLIQYGMDPSWGVSGEEAVQGYLESVEGTASGKVIDSGWRYDWTTDTMSVAVPGAASAR